MEQQNFTPPSLPSQPNPKGIKSFWPIVLLVLVILLVGVLLWQRNTASQITDSLQNKFISLQNANLTNKIVTTTSDKTASWETFSTDSRLSLPQEVIDEKPEFSLGVLNFKYPSKWKIATLPVTLEGFYRGNYFAGYIQLSKTDPSQPQSKSDLPENTAYIQISVGTTNLSPREFIEKGYLGRSSVYDKISDEKSFLGYDATKIYQTDIFPDTILFKVSPTTFFIITSEIYSFNSTSSLYYKETAEEINEILSTFKFTNEEIIATTSDETAGWKTYKNENIGVEFKIAPLFEKVGYKIIEDKSSFSQNIFGVGECNVIIFKTKPIEPFWGKVDKDEYHSMLLIQICPQKYCELVIKEAKNWKGADICGDLREGRDKTEKGDWLFAKYLAENEEFFAYLEGGTSSGDVSDAMGWEKENVGKARNQMLSTFKFTK